MSKNLTIAVASLCVIFIGVFLTNYSDENTPKNPSYLEKSDHIEVTKMAFEGYMEAKVVSYTEWNALNRYLTKVGYQLSDFNVTEAQYLHARAKVAKYATIERLREVIDNYRDTSKVPDESELSQHHSASVNQHNALSYAYSSTEIIKAYQSFSAVDHVFDEIFVSNKGLYNEPTKTQLLQIYNAFAALKV